MNFYDIFTWLLLINSLSWKSISHLEGSKYIRTGAALSLRINLREAFSEIFPTRSHLGNDASSRVIPPYLYHQHARWDAYLMVPRLVETEL